MSEEESQVEQAGLRVAKPVSLTSQAEEAFLTGRTWQSDPRVYAGSSGTGCCMNSNKGPWGQVLGHHYTAGWKGGAWEL